MCAVRWLHRVRVRVRVRTVCAVRWLHREKEYITPVLHDDITGIYRHVQGILW